MNRRSFLRKLVGGAAAVGALPYLEKVASLLPKSIAAPVQKEIGVFIANPPIGGWVSYRVTFKTMLPPGTTMRLRNIKAPE